MAESQVLDGKNDKFDERVAECSVNSHLENCDVLQHCKSYSGDERQVCKKIDRLDNCEHNQNNPIPTVNKAHPSTSLDHTARNSITQSNGVAHNIECKFPAMNTGSDSMQLQDPVTELKRMAILDSSNVNIRNGEYVTNIQYLKLGNCSQYAPGLRSDMLNTGDPYPIISVFNDNNTIEDNHIIDDEKSLNNVSIHEADKNRIGHTSDTLDVKNTSEHGNGMKTHPTMEASTSQTCVTEEVIELCIDSLPVDVLHQIFSCFTPVELCIYVVPVCSKWRDLAYDPIHWRALDLTHHQPQTVIVLRDILEHAPLLRHFTMQGAQELSFAEANHIASMCPKLTSLNIGFSSHIATDALSQFALYSHELQRLNLEGLAIFDANVNHICQLKQLRSLNLSHCKTLTDDYIVMFLKNLPHLCDINIDGISWITDFAVMKLVYSHQSVLTRVILDGAELTDYSVEVLATCSQLRTLEISFCEQLTDNSLDFIKKLTKLEHLRLNKGRDFSSSMMCELFLEGSLTNLKTLDMSECTGLRDDGVIALCKNIHLLVCSSNCSYGNKLTWLELSWCWNITDDGLTAIVENCSKMEYLCLLGLNKITGLCLGDVDIMMPCLRNLDLQQCNQINDELVSAVTRRKPKLNITNYWGQPLTADSI